MFFLIKSVFSRGLLVQLRRLALDGETSECTFPGHV